MENIRKAIKDDASSIKALTDANISRDFYSIDDIYHMIDNPVHHLFVYEMDEKIIAYIYVIILPKKEALSYLSLPVDMEEMDEFEDTDNICVYKTTCTDINYRKMGVHSQLVQYAGDFVKKQGARASILVALCDSKGAANAHTGIFEYGFVPIKIIQSPWSHILSYCPYCKQYYCKCDGKIYIKKI